MKKQLRILIVEDSEDDAFFVLHELGRGGYEVEARRVCTGADFTAQLATQEWDLVIADFSLPQFNALGALALLQQSRLDLPFIIVSGSIGEEVAVGAMKSGAHDYLLKNNLVRLVATVERELREAAGRRERRRAEASCLRLAAIVESSSDAIIGTTLGGTITDWNRGAESIFGHAAAEAVGQPMSLLLPTDRLEEADWLLERLRKGEGQTPFETVRLRKDGRRIQVSLTISPIKDGTGKTIGASNIARDITERKRAETRISAFSKLGQNLSTASMPADAAAIIGNIADDLFGWDAFTLALFSVEQDSIRTILNVDTMDGRKQGTPAAYPEGKPSPLSRRIIEQGAQLILRGGDGEDPAGAIPFGDQSRRSASLMFVPLRNHARVLGILSIQSYTPNAYEEQDLQTLQTLADYCGGALERIRAREELRESEERYRRLSDSAPIGILEGNAEGRITYVNARWMQMSGLSAAESQGFGWLRAVHPEDRETVESEWREAVAAGREWIAEHRLLAPLGVVRWVRMKAANVVSPEGRHAGHVGTVEDISQSRRAADALRAAQARLQHLMASSPAVLYSLKVQEGRLFPSWVSENIEQLTGFEPEEALSSKWWREHLPGGESEGDNLVEEFPLKRKDGAQLWIRDEKRLLRDAAGRLVEVVGSWADVTKRRLAEEELRDSREQLRAFAAHLQSVREEERKHITREIHDELGQSLTGFKMDLAWMRKRLQADELGTVREALLEKIRSMATLVDGTSNLVRKLCTELRPGVLDDLGLAAAIEWQGREYGNRTGIECQVRVELEDLDVDPDRSTALFRIFQEILTNVARHARANRVEASLLRVGQQLVLEVKDNGRGIEEEKKAGTKSLGLLGMRERATILGGTVEIQGHPGKGTHVRVTMPLAGEAAKSGAGVKAKIQQGTTHA